MDEKNQVGMSDENRQKQVLADLAKNAETTAEAQAALNRIATGPEVLTAKLHGMQALAQKLVNVLDAWRGRPKLTLEEHRELQAAVMQATPERLAQLCEEQPNDPRANEEVRAALPAIIRRLAEAEKLHRRVSSMEQKVLHTDQLNAELLQSKRRQEELVQYLQSELNRHVKAARVTLPPGQQWDQEALAKCSPTNTDEAARDRNAVEVANERALILEAERNALVQALRVVASRGRVDVFAPPEVGEHG